MKKLLLASSLVSAVFILAIPVRAAECPAVTVADSKGVPAGAFPEQYELAAFQAAAKCTLTFRQNPAIKRLNARIKGNPSLPPLAERLPAEPLVAAPYDRIGNYGGVFHGMSNATEAGTSDFLSTRHVNLVRYSDDLKTIVPDVAKGWKWNKDYTQLTFFLRKGQKWSDGAPFTAADVKFWYDDLALDPHVIKKPKSYVLVAGKRMTVEVINAETVRFDLPSPKPGLLAHFAASYAQAFQPKHFLGRFHPAINPNADKLARSMGFKNGYAAIAAYYGNSDWNDTSSPLLTQRDKLAKLPKGVTPTLEAYILVKETTGGRHLVANPYFFIVDTAGNQLPYIDEQDEIYVNETQVRLLKLVNGEVTYKEQALRLPSTPMLLDNQKKGHYTIYLKPKISMPAFSFNVTDTDLEKRKVFDNIKFRQAMSVAINRNEINKVAFFGLGQPMQYVGFSPAPGFVADKWKRYYTQYDPALAKKLLDQIGVVDRNGDGFRDLPNGKAFVLNIQFSTQGIATKVVELVAQDWSKVGIKTTEKEVTSDDYRSAQSSNQLDVGAWKKGVPLAIILGLNQNFVPPFDDYFDHRTGMLWGEYLDSNGTRGVKPPKWAYRMIDDINAFQSAPVGTAKSKKYGARLVENMTKHLLFIGTVRTPGPIYHQNALKNFTQFKTNSYEYYWAYPYRPYQWFLANKS